MKNQSKQVKERPIIFSGEMVKAILDGEKTMTRLVVKDKKHEALIEHLDYLEARHEEMPSVRDGELKYELVHYQAMAGEPYLQEPSHSTWESIGCPYKVGNRLWVRETHHVVGGIADYEIEEIKQGLQDIKNFVSYKADDYGNPCDGGWTSPIHMPRWASRILLEITDIRVERLNDIRGSDAIKEGIYPFYNYGSALIAGFTWQDRRDVDVVKSSATEAFHALWDSVNAKKGYPFSSNPWVWVVEFKVVKGE